MKHIPAKNQTKKLREYENLKFGAFVHFNIQQFVSVDSECATENDANLFNPTDLCVEQWFQKWSEAGIKYAILTTKHTSDFCLWNTKTTDCNSVCSPCKTDIVEQFVKYAKKYDIKPCFYYCLWGGEWNYKENAKEMLLNQLNELATNYGDIFLFWMDMGNWRPNGLEIQEIYDFIKDRQPDCLVQFNQHIQDGSQINYFPTDVLNGEERVPPESGHQKIRQVDGENYYLPYECELCLQCVDREVGYGYMQGTRWFTYSQGIDGLEPSHPIDFDTLYPFIKKAYELGTSNLVLSTAADYTGKVRDVDIEAIKKIRNRIKEDFGF